jgi:pimeloyl-ACP methyl ester carboxylesterase
MRPSGRACPAPSFGCREASRTTSSRVSPPLQSSSSCPASRCPTRPGSAARRRSPRPATGSSATSTTAEVIPIAPARPLVLAGLSMGGPVAAAAAVRHPGMARVLLATIRSIPSWPLARTHEELGRSELPSLLFWGREDAALPYEQSAKLLASLPGAEFRSIEGAGHVPQWEKAGEANRAILDFLRRL